MMSHTHAHCAARTIDTNMISVHRLCSLWVSGKGKKLLDKTEKEKKNVMETHKKRKITGHRILKNFHITKKPKLKSVGDSK